MPNGAIPIFDNPDAARGLEIPTQGAEAFGQAGYHVARIANQIGEDARTVLSNMESHEAMDQITTHNNGLQTLDAQIRGDGPGSWNEAKAKGTGPDDYIQGVVKPGLDALDEGITNKRAKFAATQVRNATLIGYVKEFHAEQNALDGDNAAFVAGNAVRQGANILLGNPTLLQAQLKSVTAQYDSVPYLANLPPGKRVAGRQEVADQLMTAAGEGWMLKAENPNASQADIDQVKKILLDPKGEYASAPTTKVFDWEQRLERAHSTAGALAGYEAQQQFEDVTKSIREGFATPDQIANGKSLIAQIQGSTPEETAKMQFKAGRDFESAIAYGNATRNVMTMDYDKLKPTADALTQAVGAEKDPDKLRQLEADQAAVNDAVKRRDREFKEDPTAYTIKYSPTVATAWKNFTDAPAAQKAQAFKVFGDLTTTEQKRLSPAPVQDVLPAPFKQEIASKMAVINSDPKGAFQAATELGQLRNVTGSYWPTAVHELYRAKILQPGQYVAGVLMNDPNAAPLAPEALRATSMSSKDMDKVSSLSEAKATKLAQGALSDLADTFPGASTEELGAFTTTLSAMLRARSIGSHTSDDAEAAYLAGRLITNNYSLQGGLRIPTSYDADAVVRGSKNVIADIGSHDLQVPVSLSGHGQMVQRDQYVQDVKNYGKWTTNQRGDGAILLDQQNSPVFERVKGGHVVPVELKFADFAKLDNPSSKMEKPGAHTVIEGGQTFSGGKL